MFHWSLVLLMLVALGGQATRSEGTMGLSIGEPVRDAPDGYTSIVKGPLFGERYTGLDLRADDLVAEFRSGGVDRGPAPMITVLRNGQAVVSQRVHPNSPLRYGGLSVNMAGVGPVTILSVETSMGAPTLRLPLMLDSSATDSRTAAADFSLLGEKGTPILDVRVSMSALAGTSTAPVRTLSNAPVTLVQTATVGSGRYGAKVALKIGEFMPLPGEQWLRSVSVDDWVKVRVANDWSVEVLYALFVLAAMGLGVSVFVRPRRVLVGLVETEIGPALNVTLGRSPRDEVFRRSLLAKLGNVVSETATAAHEVDGAPADRAGG